MSTKLKLEIVRSGKRQYEIAHRAGLNETELSRIIRGRRLPTPEERQRLATALDLAERDLFDAGVLPAATPDPGR